MSWGNRHQWILDQFKQGRKATDIAKDLAISTPRLYQLRKEARMRQTPKDTPEWFYRFERFGP